MSNYDQNLTAPGTSGGAIAVDAGLRGYMMRIYNYMAAGVGLTAVVAWLTYQLTGPELLQNPLMWVFILAPLALVFFISARINTLSVTTARLLFFVYAALVGVSLSILFHIYTSASRILHRSRNVRRAQHLWIHHQARPVRDRHFPVHGSDRHHHRKLGQPIPALDRARLADLDRGRRRLCRAHGLRHAADQGDVRRQG